MRSGESSDWIGWRWENEKYVDKYLGVFLEEHRFLVSDRGLESGEIILSHRAVVPRDDQAKFLGLRPPECQRFPARHDLFLRVRRRAHITLEWVILFLS